VLTNYLRIFSAWVDGADWRSWLVHGVLGWLIALVFGPVPAIVFFFLREAEQLAHELMAGTRPPWLDHALDIVAPAAAAIFLT
jgi:hypothetical protein